MLGFSLIPEGLDSTALFLTVGGLSALLVSIGKAGFGGGLGLLSVPLMILACQGRTELALAVMLPLLIVNDYVALAAWLRKWNWRPVLILLPGMAVGIGLGWLALWGIKQLDADVREAGKQQADAALMLAVGAIAVAFVALQAVRARRTEPIAFRPVLWQGTAVGAAAGLTSTLGHVAGPVIRMYMLPQNMPKDRFVATTLLYFWIGNQMKLIPYYVLGMLNPDSLGGALALMPAVVLGTATGVFLHRRVGQKQFTTLVYVLLLTSGVYFVAKASMQLWG